MHYRKAHDEFVPWDERTRLRTALVRERAARVLLVERAALDLADAERTQEAAQRAVDELEQLGLKRLFFGLAGEIEAYRRERLERLEEATAQVTACRRELEGQHASLVAADVELAGLGDLEAGLREAMQRKAQSLLDENDGPGAQLAGLLRDLDDARERRAMLTVEFDLATVARTALEQASGMLSALDDDPGVIAASVLATLFGSFDEVAGYRAIEAMLLRSRAALARVTGPGVAASLTDDERQAIGAIEVPPNRAVPAALDRGHRSAVTLFSEISHGIVATATILEAAIARLGREQEAARSRAEAVVRSA